MIKKGHCIMWYEILTLIFAGISALSSLITAIAAFSAYTVYRKTTIKQSQKAKDNAIQMQIGAKNE